MTEETINEAAMADQTQQEEELMPLQVRVADFVDAVLEEIESEQEEGEDRPLTIDQVKVLHVLARGLVRLGLSLGVPCAVHHLYAAEDLISFGLVQESAEMQKAIAEAKEKGLPRPLLEFTPSNYAELTGDPKQAAALFRAASDTFIHHAKRVSAED